MFIKYILPALVIIIWLGAIALLAWAWAIWYADRHY